MTETIDRAVCCILDEVARSDVMPRWRNLGAGDVTEKAGPDDLVTIADREAELTLTSRLAALLPGSVVVGEEAVAADASVLRRFGGTAPVWVIDPIDGTSAFADGQPEFALMVALVEHGAVTAGWIHAPAIGITTWGGSRFGGAWQQRAGEAPIALRRPSLPLSLNEMSGILGRRHISAERRALLEAKAGHFKALLAVTCAGIDYGRIARGEAQFALYAKTEPWDHLPGLAILSALGFCSAKHDGSPYRPGDNSGGLLIAPDAMLFSAISRILLGA